MGRPISVGFALLAAVIAGCVDHGGDELWGLHERRAFVRRNEAIPLRDPSNGDFQVLSPLGVDRRKLVIVARNELVLGASSGIEFQPGAPPSLIAGLGHTEIFGNATTGSIYGFGRLTELHDNARVYGHLTMCGASRIGNANVAFGVLQRSQCELEEFSWKVVFPTRNNGDRTSRAGDSSSLLLAPGAYNNVRVQPHSSLRLRSGVYYFNVLSVEPDGLLELDNTNGPLYVWIHNGLVQRGRTLDFSLEPSILLGYAGTDPPILTVNLRGTYVAPAATISLPKALVPHRGAFFARSVLVADGTLLEHESLSVEYTTLRPSDLCSLCASSARQIAESCCTNISRARANFEDAVALCPASCLQGTATSNSCVAACVESSARNTREARIWFNACVHAASISYMECQLAGGYRPDSCSNLGYGGYEPVTCGG